MLISICGEPNLEVLRQDSRLKASQQNLVSKLTTTAPDPWISSIMGKYIWKLSNIENFNVYFVKSNDTTTTQIAQKLLGTTTASVSVVDWNTGTKNVILTYCENYTSFLGKRCVEVNSFSNAQIIVVLLKDIQSTLGFYGMTLGPYYIYTVSEVVKQKCWIFINASTIDSENSFKEGGAGGALLLHEIGHAFGLSHPHDEGAQSTIMPGVTSPFEPGGYDMNRVINTVMSYQWNDLTLPNAFSDFTNDSIGYPDTIMAFDYAALRRMYNINNFGTLFLQKFAQPVLYSGRSSCFVGVDRVLQIPSSLTNVLIYIQPSSISVRQIGRQAGNRLAREAGSNGVITLDERSNVKTFILSNQGICTVYVYPNMDKDRTIMLTTDNVPTAIRIFFQSVTSLPESRKTVGNKVQTLYRDPSTKKTLTIIQEGSGKNTLLTVSAATNIANNNKKAGRSIRISKK